MTLRLLSFHIAASACLLAQGGPVFTVEDAIRAEWARQAPAFTEAQKANLSPVDRARLELTLRRIGRPGDPELLPPELANPAAEAWLAKAKAARTPRVRFDALAFLNRLKRPEALTALAGLRAEDAATWPKYLHLEAGIATARLNGAEIGAELQGFLDGLKQAGKVDPVRAQAAQLRLVMGGKELELLPPVKAAPGNVLAILDALRNQKQVDAHPRFKAFISGRWEDLGLRTPPEGDVRTRYFAALRSLDLQITPATASRMFEMASAIHADHPGLYFTGMMRHLAKLPVEARATRLKSSTLPPLEQALLLPELRGVDPAAADALREAGLSSSHSIARSAAIDDLPAAPEDLQTLTARVWNDQELEPRQTLIQSYARWKLPPERQKPLLAPWLEHPDWACRWEAYQALKKLDPATPWPAAPPPTKAQAAILEEAKRLASTGKPVRLRVMFEGGRSIVLRLDPSVAPINVANLVHLAKRGFFNGRCVPRVVPDFVVQMGSPYDTTDGGPGYSVRCEYTLDWYGPGSVGMALGGKDTGGSQFFITTNATPHLTGKYTRMGQVEDLDHAMPILDNLELGTKILRIAVVGK